MTEAEMKTDLLALANSGSSDAKAVLGDFAGARGLVVKHVDGGVEFKVARSALIGATVLRRDGSTLALDSGVVVALSLGGD